MQKGENLFRPLCEAVQKPNCSSHGSEGSEDSPEGDRDVETRVTGLALQSYQKTFRVQGIPHGCNRSETKQIIKAALRLEDEEAGLKVYSLAFNPYRQTEGKVATVSFTKVPGQLAHTVAKDSWKFSFKTSESSQAFHGDEEKDYPPKETILVFDTHFRGFTPLRSFQNVSDHKIDCIAISGLGGHSFGSFKERGGSHMWLRDSLPYDLPGTRILIYGYDTRLEGSQSFQNLRTLAGQLRNQIKAVRGDLADNVSPKPLIFVAHSLGGLIVKQALIQMSEGDDWDQANLKATYGALFFGVPSQGMDIASLVPMVGNQPNRYFLESLGKDSEILQEQRLKFPKAFGFRDSEIISFFETQESPTAEQQGDKWSMTGNPTVLVDSASATHSRPWELEDRYVHAINRSHSDLIKFSSQDEDYEVVLHLLRRFSSLAPKVVLDRFKTDHASTLLPSPTEEAEEQISVQLTKDQQACLQSLAFQEIYDREHDVRPRAEKTCVWIVEHETFLDWLDQRCGLLWIKGKPGAGKSTLLKHALGETKKIDFPKNKLVIASHFFHGRGMEIQKTPLGLYRALLHHLLNQVPEKLSELVENFKEKLRSQGEPGTKWNWHPGELQTLLAASLLKIGKIYTIRIFVDALDECGEETALELVDYFQRLVSVSLRGGGSLSICFSCRHYPIVALESAFEICVEDENHEDIERYIQVTLQSVRDPTKIGILRELITARAEGSFQWVTLVIPMVSKLHRRGKSLQFIQSQIQKIPAELNNLYRDLLQSIEEENLPQSLQLIQWIYFALRPLTLDELRQAVAVGANNPFKSFRECRNSPEYVDTEEEMELRVIDLCRGLAEIRNLNSRRVVQFIHQSVNDFLIQDGFQILDNSLGSADVVTGRAHFQLSRACIKYIGMEEIGSWVELAISENLQPWDVPVEFSFIEYATTHWLFHVQTVETKGIKQNDLLPLFQWPSKEPLRRYDYFSNRAYFRNQVFDIHRLHLYPGMDLIHIASGNNLLSVLEAILKRGFDINSISDGGLRPSSPGCAAEKGYEAVVKSLLEPVAELESKDNYNKTPLSCAAGSGHEAAVKLLLESGADPESRDNFNKTPLSLAAEVGHEAIVKLLLAKGAKVDLKDKRGQNPLTLASMNGKAAVVKLLLENRADLEPKDVHNRTPLSLAAKNGHEVVVKLLLESGAVLESKDKFNKTPLSLAAEVGHEAVVKRLLEMGANVDSRNKWSMTPLTLAARSGHEAVVKLLLEKGANVDAMDRWLQTPLFIAAHFGHDRVVALLLEKGANTDSTNERGRTPIVTAAKNGHEAVVRLLLEKGANGDFSIS